MLKGALERGIAMALDLPNTIRAIIQNQLGVHVEDLRPGARFVQDLGADSLAVVELNWAFEKAFGFEIPDADAHRLETVQGAIDYLSAHIVARGAG
jgi:acyl carrier protein